VSTGTSFTEQTAKWNVSVKWIDFQVADFNGDGRDDLAARFQPTEAGDSAWWVALANGAGSFQAGGRRWTVWGNLPWKDVQTADYNGDGKADIVGRDPRTGRWRIAQSTGTRFVSRDLGHWAKDASPNGGWHNVLIADLNGDGKDDIVGQNSKGQWSWIHQQGNRNVFTAAIGTWAPADDYQSVFAADLNQDGKDELFGRRGTTGQWRIDRLNATTSKLATLNSPALKPTWDDEVDWLFASLGEDDEGGLV
jgi:hypothetical protein